MAPNDIQILQNKFEGVKNKRILFFIYLSIFVNSIVFFTSPFEFYLGYLIYIVLLPVFISRHGIPKFLIYLFFFLLVNGIFHVQMGNNTYAYFFKIFLGVFLSYVFYYLVIVEFDLNVERLFQLYLKGSYIVCLIGLFQFVSYLIKFSPGYNYSWILNKWGVPVGGNYGIRINSIFGEPSYFAICISSAAFIAIRNLLFKDYYYLTRFQSVVIILASFLTFSGIGYFGLFLAIVFLFVNFGLFRYFIVFIPVFFLVFLVVYNNVPDFKDRYDSTVEIFTTGKYTVGKTHGSSIILYNNYQVAVQNFKDYFLGTGLGSHPVAFEKYSITKDVKLFGFSNNNLDANSMFNRLLSETGMLGIALFFFLIIKCFVKRNAQLPLSDSYWLISNSILVMILLNLFRQGHYFLNGFPFFVWLYYFNYVQYKKQLTSS